MLFLRSFPGVGRRGLLLFGAILTAGGLITGLALHFARSRPPAVVPPDPAIDATEPELITAVRLARERVLKAPDSAREWGSLGQVFQANDLDDPAAVCFTEAARLDPGNPRWPYFLGGRLINRGEREAALPYLRRAMAGCEAEGKGNNAPRLTLAEVLLQLGELDEAETHFQTVLQRDPDDVRAHLGLGQLLAARQDWEASRSHLLRCLGSPMTRQRANIQLTLVCQRLGDSVAAEKYRAQAEHLPHDLDWIDPYLNENQHLIFKKKKRYKAAENLEASGELARAAAILQPMAEDYPDDYLPLMTLGKLLARMNQLHDAELLLRRARQLAPDKAQIHYYLSLVLCLQGEELMRRPDGDRAQGERLLREAVASADQVLALKSDYGFAYMSRGLARKYLGQRVEAVADLRQAVRCNPEYAELHFRLGELLVELKMSPEEARQHLEEALDMSAPGDWWQATARARLAELKTGRTPAPPDEKKLPPKQD
jgi:tetratricopeptide (TPR) repeat protein